jgi:hypothetical protein
MSDKHVLSLLHRINMPHENLFSFLQTGINVTPLSACICLYNRGTGNEQWPALERYLWLYICQNASGACVMSVPISRRPIPPTWISLGHSRATEWVRPSGMYVPHEAVIFLTVVVSYDITCRFRGAVKQPWHCAPLSIESCDILPRWPVWHGNAASTHSLQRIEAPSDKLQ